jgi:diadenosine tetraphosphate (Ap4A) HIT family hydrolase
VTLDRLWAGWRAEYIEGVAGAPEPRPVECLFCALAALDDEEGRVLARNEHAFAVMNAYPYTSGHLMVASLRHEATLSGLRREEGAALMALTQDATAAIDVAYRPEGMNVGVNIGRAGGAGIPGHVHVHALPRWNGDTNFMTAVAETRVLPESLRTSYDKLRAAWPGSDAGGTGR